MPRRFDRFVESLRTVRLNDRACNQYEHPVRRRNLKRYLEEVDGIGSDTLLVGEAPSHRGGCRTGIAFVSERIMLDGVPIRSAPGHILGRGYRKATDDDTVSTEASATMVWETIREIDPLPMLWNAFPFHPFHRGNPLTNRVPDAGELIIGQQFLRTLMTLFDFRNVVAIGNQASISLTRMEIPHIKVRHPSQGGKNKFVVGMAGLSQWKASEEPMPRKSQIQEIKEGRSMHERVYNNRNQPQGPKAPLPTKNAVRLSTVPASSDEKYNGGKD